ALHPLFLRLRWLILSRCRQYYFVNQSLNWFGAQYYCRQNYTGLANIGNTEEMTQLITTVSSAGYNSEVWIGVYVHLDWHWSSQTNNDFWKWANQTANEPLLVYYQCGTALINGWRCSNCSVEHPFICYNGEKTAKHCLKTVLIYSQKTHHDRFH
uniref:C-type lectin domain-containing protein n=1 Tax=Amphilophus citrinellus TaxID=61819 RepID=A0A3Q0SRN9_AMPCI